MSFITFSLFDCANQPKLFFFRALCAPLYSNSNLFLFFLSHHGISRVFPNSTFVALLFFSYDTAGHSTTDQKIITSVWLRVINVLRHWLDKAWFDFKKDCPDLSNKTIAFMDYIMDNNASMRKAAEQIRNKLQKLLAGESDTSAVRAALKTPKPLFPKDGPDTQLIDIHPEEIARQLTLVRIFFEVDAVRFHPLTARSFAIF